jgi:hypothetical protein
MQQFMAAKYMRTKLTLLFLLHQNTFTYYLRLSSELVVVLLFQVGWLRIRIFLFREIRNNAKSDFNFAKVHKISLYFLTRNFAKFRINYFAKLFCYENFSNTNTPGKISFKLFCEMVLLCKFLKSNT